uniref:FAS1 domain-containing protein n=1 Tax=Davidia involucrata TaxID=16924 RepID=A0A5B7BMY4_DAVIN
MAIFHLHYQGPPHSFFKLFAISLPLFCLLISWAASTTPPPPPLSALTAAEALRTRGYSLFAAIIDAAATDTDSWNGTGTILAPPDFAFSFATAKFNSHRHAPPRPSTSLLLYHTLKKTLTWHNLTARSDGHEFRTLYDNRCVFVSKNFNGELSIAGTKKTVIAVKIRQPDLYVDDQLTVHGIDGVLDPSSASKCSFPDQQFKVQIKTEIDRSYLDHAVRALRRRGFSMVATAMAIKRCDLMNLTALTVFAPSDLSLFSASDGFRYDFRYHVVPNRLRFADLARLPVGTEIETTAPNKTVVIGSINGVLTVNGVTVDGSEIYHNQRVVMLSVSRTFDEAGDSEAKSQFSSGFSDSGRAEVPSRAPSYSSDSDVKNQFSDHDGVPSPAQGYYGDSKSRFPGGFSYSGRAGVPSTAPSYSSDSDVKSQLAERDGVPSPAQSYYGDLKSWFPGGFSDSGPAEVPSTAPSYSNVSGVKSQHSERDGVPSPAQGYFGDSMSRFPGESPGIVDAGMPSPSPSYTSQGESGVGLDDTIGDSRRSPAESPFADLNSSPAEYPFPNLNPSPVVLPVCPNGVVSTRSDDVEGQDLFCPETVRTEAAKTVYVAQSPSSADSGQLSEEETQSAPSDTYTPSDEHESGPLSEISSVQIERRQVSSKSESSSDVDANNVKSNIRHRKGSFDRRDHFSVADDLFFYN